MSNSNMNETHGHTGLNGAGPDGAGPGTTGHEWDGLQELNNPLPRWWLWIFYACIAFSVVWMVLYPAWPVPGGNTRGTLGYSSRADVEQQMAALESRRDAALKGIEQMPVADIDSFATAETETTAEADRVRLAPEASAAAASVSAKTMQMPGDRPMRGGL